MCLFDWWNNWTDRFRNLENTDVWNALRPSLAFCTFGQVGAPRQIPLAHQDLGAHQLEAGVALVGDHGAVDQVGVGRALPAVGDLGQLGARVVPLHLFWIDVDKQEQGVQCLVAEGGGKATLGVPFITFAQQRSEGTMKMEAYDVQKQRAAGSGSACASTGQARAQKQRVKTSRRLGSQV